MNGPRVLLVVGGGIAAYKSCELVRLIRKEGGEVTCVLTDGGSRFVTPMALGALSENPVYTTLWDLKNEVEMGHIQLSRQADLVVVCPATADLLAKMSHGIADDLATTLLLATDKPVMAVPAMNVRMWQHSATMRNVETLRSAGVDVMEPEEGSMACGEFGPGRLPEPIAIWQRIAWVLGLGPVEVAPLPGSAPAAGPASLSVPAPGYALLPESAPDTTSVQFSLPEPDEEDEREGSGLGGLSGLLISRGRKQPGVKADEPPVDAEMYSAPSDEPDLSEAEDQAPPLNLDSPLLSKRGKARAAPPTVPAAFDHLVSGEGDGPPELPEAQPEFVADPGPRPLEGKHVLITAGPTYEKIDPVRYIANRSSGKQGYAIAAAAAAAGAQVTLVSGPVNLRTPPGVDRIDVESAQEMAEAVKNALPADAAIMVAAVADWRLANAARDKIKKRGSAPPALLLTENPDILAMVGAMPNRPGLLIGFAAETQDVIKNAKDKRKRKGADWIVANDVSGDVMGGSANTVHIVTGNDVESLPEMPKEEVARAIVERIADELER